MSLRMSLLKGHQGHFSLGLWKMQGWVRANRESAAVRQRKKGQNNRSSTVPHNAFVQETSSLNQAKRRLCLSLPRKERWGWTSERLFCFAHTDGKTGARCMLHPNAPAPEVSKWKNLYYVKEFGYTELHLALSIKQTNVKGDRNACQRMSMA